MAKVKPSPLVSSIRGKIGQVVFQVWKGINTARNMPISIHNPSTARQSVVRNLLSSLKLAWDTLSHEQRTAWNQYAQGLGSGSENQIGTSQLIKPVGTAMSGYNAFIGINIRLQQIGLPFVLQPPQSGVPGIVELSVPSLQSSAFISLNAALPEGAVVGQRIRVFCKGSWAASHIWLQQDHAITSDDITAGVVMLMITTARAGNGNLYADLPISFYNGKNLEVQVDIVDISGAKSSNSNVVIVPIVVDVPDSLSTLFGLTAAGYQSEMDIYSLQAGVPNMAAVNWFSAMVVNFCILNALDWTTMVAIANMTTAEIPLSINLQVDGGYLPPVDGSTELNTSYVPE